MASCAWALPVRGSISQRVQAAVRVRQPLRQGKVTWRRLHEVDSRSGRVSRHVRCFSASPLGISGADVLTTDATFRYRTLDWQASDGKTHDYEYVIAQQPAGGATQRTDALTALEEELPPPRGHTVVLIPSVSFVCGGKEEMRPLAAGLCQRGHRCYILEWPGWTADVRINSALELCKVEELIAEYEDFWCQVLEQIGRSELRTVGASRLCIVGAGNSGIYAMRALGAMRAWSRESGFLEKPNPPIGKVNNLCPEVSEESSAEAKVPSQTFDGTAQDIPLPEVLDLYQSFVFLGPSWRTARHGWLDRVNSRSSAACHWLARQLNSGGRLGGLFRTYFFSARHTQSYFLHGDAWRESHADETAKWLLRRRRPHLQTDAAALLGFFDPLNSEALAKEITKLSENLSQGILMLLPRSSGVGEVTQLAEDLAPVRRVQTKNLECDSVLPHEVAPTEVILEVEQWLEQAGDS